MGNNRTVLKPAILIVASLLALSILLGSCSDDDAEGTRTPDIGAGTPSASVTVQDQPDPVQPPAGTPGQPEDGVYEVIAQNSAFQGNDITLPLGQTSAIRVTNRDEVSHNLRIAGIDGQYDTEDDAVTEPESIAPGSSGELSFAPAIAGTYTFRCDYHPGSMGGEITVE